MIICLIQFFHNGATQLLINVQNQVRIKVNVDRYVLVDKHNYRVSYHTKYLSQVELSKRVSENVFLFQCCRFSFDFI